MRRTSVRVALALAGIALIAVIVRSLGADRVAAALVSVAPWLPLVVLLEIAIASTDVLALHGFLARSIAARTWIRASALAYAMSATLPAGRAAGEAARASVLKEEVGLARAVDGGASLQTASLYGTAFISLVGAIAAAGALRIAVGLNVALCLVGALGVRFAVRWPRVRKWLGGTTAPNDAVTARMTVWCCLGRIIQAMQYGVVLHALGGDATPRAALIVQGVHVVGATAGDMIPNQLGATEGAYRVFADAVGFGDAPARAVTIALVIRMAQLALAASAWPVALLATPPRADP